MVLHVLTWQVLLLCSLLFEPTAASRCTQSNNFIQRKMLLAKTPGLQEEHAFDELSPFFSGNPLDVENHVQMPSMRTDAQEPMRDPMEGAKKQLPKWTSLLFDVLRPNVEQCQARVLADMPNQHMDGDAQSKTTAVTVTNSWQLRTPRKCPSAHVLLRRFEGYGVHEECCPDWSMACSGCIDYNATTDVCNRCDTGYVRSAEALQCQLCSDFPGWRSPQGDTCANYGKLNWCRDGAPTHKGLAMHNGSMQHYVSMGLSPLTACCVCGGGERQPGFWFYKTNTVPFALGTGNITVSPTPRVAQEYATTDCDLHKSGFTLDPRTGTVSGSLAATEPTELTCSITAIDRKHKIESATNVELSFVHFAYPAKVLYASPGKVFSPTTASKGSFADFSVSCTPHVVWLHINATTGALFARGPLSEMVPRLARCTVKGVHTWCPVGKGVQDSECMKEPRETDIDLVVPNEATSLFLIHRDAPEVAISNMHLTASKPTPPFVFVPTLDKNKSFQLDAPVAYHIDCGPNTRFDVVTRTVMTVEGFRIFDVMSDGQVRGMPSASTLKECTNQSARCSVTFACRVYGIAPFSKGLTSTDFNVTVWEDLCWAKLHGDFQRIEGSGPTNLNMSTESTCREWCRSVKACAAFTVGHDGKCSAVRAAGPRADRSTLSNTTVYGKIRGCSRFQRCIQFNITGESYLMGSYCPLEVHDQGWPLYKKEGAVEGADLYLQRYTPESEYVPGDILQACGSKTPVWILRRSSTGDLVLPASEGREQSLVELQGDTLLCFWQDIVVQAFEKDGTIQLDAVSGAVDPTSPTSLQASVQVELMSCPSPLMERAEFLAKQNEANEFANEQAAMNVFRFDDLSSELPDDFSAEPCECLLEGLSTSNSVGQNLPVGSGNEFVPPPQLLASGSLACELSALIDAFATSSDEDCMVAATNSSAKLYWVGTHVGLRLCRLYAECERLFIEHESEGQLYGISRVAACAISDPDTCWSRVKQNSMFTGASTAVLDGSPGRHNVTGAPPCLHENIFRACEWLLKSGMHGVEMCGRCKYLRGRYLSLRLPMPVVFPSSFGLFVSCHPDRYRGMLRGSESGVFPGVALSCVDGRWVDQDMGLTSMSHFSCVEGVQVSSSAVTSLAAQEAVDGGFDWWSRHYGWRIINWEGKCLAPDHAYALPFKRYEIDVYNGLVCGLPCRVWAAISQDFCELTWQQLCRGYTPAAGLSDKTLMREICPADCRAPMTMSQAMEARQEFNSTEAHTDPYSSEIPVNSPPQAATAQHQLRLTEKSADLHREGRIDASLIAHFTYDDDSCKDVSGNGHHGVGHGKPMFANGTAVSAVRGRSLQVAGCSRCEVPSLAGHAWGTQFTACTWFRRSRNDGSYQVVLSTGYHEEGSWEFRLGRENWGTDGGGSISGGNGWRWHLRAEFALNQWHHVCMTYDAEVSNVTRFYHNGKALGDIGPAPGPMKTVSQPVYIGSAGTVHGPSECFAGNIDSTRLYSKALSATDIKDLYSRERHTDISLIAHFSYDDGSCKDVSGNGHHGVGLGKPTFATGTGLSTVRGRFLQFAGCSRCEVPSLAGHAWGTQFTACTWFRRTRNDGSYQGILSTGYHEEGSWKFWLGRNNNGTDGGGSVAGGTEWRWYLQAEFALNQWHHVCMTYDTHTSNTTRFYHNGSMVGAIASASGPMKTVPKPVYIGSAGRVGGPSECFTGDIDSTRLYSKALSAADIEELYNSEQDCAPGWFKANRHDRCRRCIGGATRRRRAYSKCALCPKGKMGVANQDTCMQCPLGSVAGQIGATTCMRCAAGRYDDGRQFMCLPCSGGSVRRRRHATSCSGACPEMEFNNGTADNCTKCPEGRFSKKGAVTCSPCCPQGLSNCTCNVTDDQLTSWRAEIPLASGGSTMYGLTFSLNDTDGSLEGCTLNDQRAMHHQVLKLRGSGKAVIEFRAVERNRCKGIQKLSISVLLRASWGTCREPSRDTWVLQPTESVPGFARLFFAGQDPEEQWLCAAAEDGMCRQRSDSGVRHLFPLKGLSAMLHQWTLGEQGLVEYPCGNTFGDGTFPHGLLEAGLVGDPLKQNLLAGIALRSPHTRVYRASYWSREAPFRSSDCVSKQTPCSHISEVYNLEAHKVECGQRSTIRGIEFKKCSGNLYQYEYSCCRLVGLGGCTLALTPFTDVSGTDNVFEALSQHVLRCPINQVLKAFVLEAKDPSGKITEIRYVYECCLVEAVPSLSLQVLDVPLNASFKAFEGMYYPSARQEGRLQMVSHELHAKAVGVNATLRFNKHTGKWCLSVNSGTPAVCRHGPSAVHPLQLGAGQPFEVTPLGGLQASGEAPQLKQIDVVKLKAPPDIAAAELEEVAFREGKPLVEVSLDKVDMTPVELKESEALKEVEMQKKEFQAEALKEAKALETRALQERQLQGAVFKEGKTLDLEVQTLVKANALEEVKMTDLQFKEFVPGIKAELKPFDLRKTEVDFQPMKPNYPGYCSLRHADFGYYPEDRDHGPTLNSRLKYIPPYSKHFIEQPWHPCHKYFTTPSSLDREPYKTDFDLGRMWDWKSDRNAALRVVKAGSSQASATRRGNYRKAGYERKAEKYNRKKEAKGSPKRRELTEADGRTEYQKQQDAKTNVQAEYGAAKYKYTGEKPGAIKADDKYEVSQEEEKGWTISSMEKCNARAGVRKDRLLNEERNSQKKQIDYDLGHTAASIACSWIPSTSGVMAPLGGGVSVFIDASEICTGVSDAVHSTLTEINERYLLAQTNWKAENDGLDDCGAWKPYMYKMFCDLHCIENAVVKGNEAVLKSLKEEEKSIIRTVTDAVKHYNAQVNENIAKLEKQQHHDTKDIVKEATQGIMDQNTEYTKKMLDQNFNYAKQIMGQAKANTQYLGREGNEHARQLFKQSTNYGQQLMDQGTYYAEQIMDQNTAYTQKQLEQSTGYAKQLSEQGTAYANQAFEQNNDYTKQIMSQNSDYSKQLMAQNTNYALQSTDQRNKLTQQTMDQATNYAGQMMAADTQYTKQVMDRGTDYTKQIMDQATEYGHQFMRENSRMIKALDSNTKDQFQGLSKILQPQHKTLNENLQTVYDWLQKQEKDRGPLPGGALLTVEAAPFHGGPMQADLTMPATPTDAEINATNSTLAAGNVNAAHLAAVNATLRTEFHEINATVDQELKPGNLTGKALNASPALQSQRITEDSFHTENFTTQDNLTGLPAFNASRDHDLTLTLTNVGSMLGEVQRATVALVHELHGTGEGHFNAALAQQLLPKLAHDVGSNGQSIVEALQNSNHTDAHAHGQHLAHSLHSVRMAIAESRETTSEAFHGQSKSMLRPVLWKLGLELATTALADRSLLAFHSQRGPIMQRAQTVSELGDAMEANMAVNMLIRFDMETIRVHRSVATCFEVARKYLRRYAALVSALADAAQIHRCNSPEELRDLGQQLAEADQAHEVYFAGLGHAWSNVADSMTRIADLLVDGGLLLHYLRLVARNVEQNSWDHGATAGTHNHRSIAEAASAMEAPLLAALSTDGSRFTKHITVIIELSQLLSDMWTNAGYDPPPSELAALRTAWGRVSLAARELREGLRGSGELRRDILLGHVEAADVAPLHMRFPPPTACRHDGQVLALWRMEGNLALLVSHEQGRVAFHCDVRRGHLERAAKESLRLEGGDLGKFVERLID